MVVPVFGGEYHGSAHHTQCQRATCRSNVFIEVFVDEATEKRHAKTNVKRKGIETSGVCVVTFAGLVGSLIEIYNNCDARQYEKHHYNPKIPFAGDVGAVHIYHTEDAEQQRQEVITVVALVVFQRVGQQRLVAEPCIVDETNARNPVAVHNIAVVALDVVLPAHKIPHKIP